MLIKCVHMGVRVAEKWLLKVTRGKQLLLDITTVL